ncbi:MAG: AmmeMemoRadiSam system protein B [Planctomycetota bacterium]
MALLSIATFCRAEEQNIRPAALAGTWYKNNPVELTKDIENYLAQVPAKLIQEIQSQKIAGFITPHAGHQYSGPGAAYLYALIKNKPIKRVILIGPSHHAGYHGIAVSGFTHYRTPLGLVEIDLAVCRELSAADPIFCAAAEAEKREHSLEIQLPFLQTVLQDFKLVPLMVGKMAEADYLTAARIIKPLIDDETLLITSSDFTHYGAGFNYTPYKENVRAEIEASDRTAIQHALDLNVKNFLDYVEKSGMTICGYRPIALMLSLLPEKSQGQLLHYYASGDATRNYSHSVSYASVIFMKPSEKDSTKLNKREQATLLKLARDTLRMYLKDKKTPDLSNYELTPLLKKELGVFVTLMKKGRLRGCIGQIFDPEPLAQGVINNTISAATRDPRFIPMTGAEEPEVHLDISVLSPLRPVKNYEEIIVGTHGVYLVNGGYSAVYLPQVAPEQGWNRDQMLESLSLKAGLPTDAWQSKNTQFFVFTAQVFEE